MVNKILKELSKTQILVNIILFEVFVGNKQVVVATVKNGMQHNSCQFSVFVTESFPPSFIK